MIRLEMWRCFSSALRALSPLDGRYATATAPLREFYSESALMKYRARVEIAWFIHLSKHGLIYDRAGSAVRLTPSDTADLNSLWQSFQESDGVWVKDKERETNHDLKAVEYYLKSKMPERLKPLSEFFHVCCTSEDINNLSYALMMSDSVKEVVVPSATKVRDVLAGLAVQHANTAMLSRTHGQPASPTTLGKEMANFAYRANRQIGRIREVKLFGKCNGAVGNYNAHIVTYPGLNWLDISQEFVEGLGLHYNPYTTQIEPHDGVAELCGAVAQLNTVLLDLARDMWGYISLSYFKGAVRAKEVGSSTMPHKVNPIDFENAEGNLGIANALLTHLQHKLPISRFQRDLSDSTAIRNVGSSLGYSVLAYHSLIRGFDRASVNEPVISHDLDQHWEVLAEPVQMILRRHGFEQPYELLKELTRGKAAMGKSDYQALIQGIVAKLNLKKAIVEELTALTPEKYIGLAGIQATSLPKYFS